MCKGQDIYCAAAALRISTLPLFVVPPFRRLGQERRPAALRPSCPPAPGAWGQCPDAPPVTVRVGVRSDEIPKCARDRTSIVSTHDLRQLVGAPHPSNAKSTDSDPVAVAAAPFWEFRPAIVRDRTSVAQPVATQRTNVLSLFPGARRRCPEAPLMAARVGVKSDGIPKYARDWTGVTLGCSIPRFPAGNLFCILRVRFSSAVAVLVLNVHGERLGTGGTRGRGNEPVTLLGNGDPSATSPAAGKSCSPAEASLGSASKGMAAWCSPRLRIAPIRTPGSPSRKPERRRPPDTDGRS